MLCHKLPENRTLGGSGALGGRIGIERCEIRMAAGVTIVRVVAVVVD
jgi:hypothetical protein